MRAGRVGNIILACAALGSGVCWIEGYARRNEEMFREVFGIPENCRQVTLVSIGVPDEQPVKEKKTLQEVLHWQRYGGR